jgi:hypothetical protein
MPSLRDSLSARQATLCHGSVLLLEPVAQALRALHVLVDASHNATLFARGERLALEAVDAGVEALLDEVGVHLEASAMHDFESDFALIERGRSKGCTHVHEFLHLLLLHAVLELTLLVLGKPGRG